MHDELAPNAESNDISILSACADIAAAFESLTAPGFAVDGALLALAAFAVGAAVAVAVADAVGASSGLSSTTGGGTFFAMSISACTLSDSFTTGSIQSLYIAPIDAEVQEEAEGRDDGERPVDLAGETAFDREWQLRSRLHRRRRDELEEERRIADDDLAARFVGEANLVDAAGLLRLAL